MSPDTLLLWRLLEAGDRHVSGEELAAELGMSRVGVWQRLRRLRAAGLQFAAVRNRGHRLVGEPEHLHGALLAAHCQRAGVDRPVHYLAVCDSSNSEATRRLADGEATPFVVCTAAQTAGRGRRGRIWHSPDEGNLYASFAFRPDLPPARLQAVTLWFGLRICAWLNEVYGLPVRLKWPNDLLLEGRKVCGMLTEARVDADAVRELVFGIGLNVNSRPEAWPAEQVGAAGSLSRTRGAALPLHALAAQLVATVLAAWQAWREGGQEATLLAAWPRYDALAGLQVQAEYSGQPLTGTALGIAADGSLRLRTAAGKVQHLHAGEVSVRPPQA
jgi:BirA family biotin operon repressor/biotin-[acetyl-CoA-carboxylase] ligase